MKFEIGQSVWEAAFTSEQVSVTCPDCGGEGRLRVIMYDKTEVSIECGRCQIGSYPSSGRVSHYYAFKPMARQSIITGVEIENGVAIWKTDVSYRIKEERIFTNSQDALNAARIIAAKYNQKEIDKIKNKEKDTRSWSWNASYHRTEIKNHERQIEYHKSKLAVASLKAKEEKK